MKLPLGHPNKVIIIMVCYFYFYFYSPIEQAYLPSCRDGQSQPRLLLIDEYDNVKQKKRKKLYYVSYIFRTKKYGEGSLWIPYWRAMDSEDATCVLW